MYPFQRAPRYHSHSSDIVNNLIVYIEPERYYEPYYDISGNCSSRSRSRSPRSRSPGSRGSGSRSPRGRR